LSQELLKTKLSSPQKRMVKTLRSASRLVLFYSNDLIDQNTIEQGHLAAHNEGCFPAEAIVDILEVLRGDCQSRKLAFSF